MSALLSVAPLFVLLGTFMGMVVIAVSRGPDGTK
jgi:hypothetical protein